MGNADLRSLQMTKWQLLGRFGGNTGSFFDVRHTVLGLNSACIRTGIVIRCNHTRIVTTSVLIPHAVHSEPENLANWCRGYTVGCQGSVFVYCSLFAFGKLSLEFCGSEVLFLLIALLTGAQTYQGLPFNGARGEEEEV